MESGKRAELRRIGHPLRPLMRIGKGGATDAFVKELGTSLKAHQLVKVKLDGVGKEEWQTRARELAERSKSELVDVVGGSALLYLEDPEDPLVRG